MEYVPSISAYAKEDIKDMNSPARKDKALVGKSVYFENNITFDENPRIFHEIIETQISPVAKPANEIHQRRLWKGWKGGIQFQNVFYVKRN